MNPAVFGSPAAACASSTQGAAGPDRIVHDVYEKAGLISLVQAGWGTGLQQTTVAYTRTTNGDVSTLTDAKGNVTAYAYDAFDRTARVCYNSRFSACQGNTTTDYEGFSYDNAGNVTGRAHAGRAELRVQLRRPEPPVD
jgi:YD repeat-containing protein